MEKDSKMINKGKRTLALAMTGTLLIGTCMLPTRAAMVATEQPLEGVNVVLEEYCNEVLGGKALAQITGQTTASSPAVTETPAPTEAPQLPETSDVDDEKDEVEEHVELNLNYSRLGIATNVDTYLNVRKNRRQMQRSSVK